MKILNKIKKIYSRMSLRTTILIIMSFIIILAVFSSNYLLIGYSNKFIYSLSNNYIQTTIGQSVSRIDSDLFDGIYQFSNALMKDEEICEFLLKKSSDESETDKIDKVIFGEDVRKKYVAGLEKIKIVALLGKNGQIYSVNYSNEFDSNTLKEFKEVSEECKETSIVKWFPLREYSSTNAIKEDLRNKNSIWIYRALRNPSTGEYMGTGVFSVSEKEIYGMYKDSKISNLTETVVFTNDGGVVSSNNFNGELRMSGTQAQNLIKNGMSKLTITSNGKKYLVLTKPLKIDKWYISNKIPVSDIYQEASKLMLFGVIIISIFIFISFLLIDTLSKKIVNPLKRIIKAMERTEHGDFSTQVVVGGQYEISQLGRYFNNMVSKISDMILIEYELERKKKEAEMNVLMSQINPHFLYNTLESIVWKAQIAGEAEIGEMAAALGDIYRISVNQGNPLVLIADELRHINAYAYIQKIRYKNNFNFEYFVEDDELLRLYTIKMLLQPMVENSIIHGINTGNKPLNVRVEIKKQGEDILFSIIDNGTGVDEESIKTLLEEINSTDVLKTINLHTPHKKYRGIGIHNTNDRIKLYFGDDYGLKIESNLGQGTRIDILIPRIEGITEVLNR